MGIAGTTVFSVQQATGSWQKIALSRLSVAAASIVFGSIPTGYKALEVRGNLYMSAAGNYFRLRLNNDSTASYDFNRLKVLTTVVSADNNTGQTSVFGDGNGAASASDPYWFLMQVSNQTLGDTHSGVFMNGSAIEGTVCIAPFRYTSTSEISEVDILASAGNFAIGSYVELWGSI